MKSSLTCIVCPNGCHLEIDTAEQPCGAVSILNVTGGTCPKGEQYARQELINPQRNIATSVAVTGGVFPLVSVRLTAPIPKERIFEAIEEIKKCVITAPIEAGAVIIHHILGYEADVITTKSVEAR